MKAYMKLIELVEEHGIDGAALATMLINYHSADELSDLVDFIKDELELEDEE